MPLKQVAPRRAHVACFNTPRELLKTFIVILLMFFSPFFSCISIFLPGTHLGLCVVLVFNLCTSCQTFSLVCLCALCDTVQSGERPPRQHVAGHGQTVLGNQGWSLAVVKAVRPAACVSLTLSCWVCLVSGTSFSIHLLLPSLFFKLTTPYPILSFHFPFISYLQEIVPQTHFKHSSQDIGFFFCFSLWALHAASYPFITQCVLVIHKLLVSNSS